MATFRRMNQIQWTRPYAGRVAETPREKVAFLQKVYGLFTGSLVLAATGAMLALYAGAGVSQVAIQVGSESLTVPPLVALFMRHPFLGMLIPFGAIMAASFLRHKPGINVAALFGATFISGISLGPTLFWAQLMTTAGGTLSPAPIRDAFLLTVMGFGGLTGYVFVSKRDFSFLRGFVSIGIFVLLGAMLLNFFIGGATFGLAISSVGVILFGAFVLYDTSRLLREESRDPVGGALSLYLNFVNMFLMLLRILASRRD